MSEDMSLIHLGETSTTAMDSPSFEFTAERAIDLINTGLKGANPDLYTIRKSQFGRDPTDENYLSSFLQRMIKN